MISKITADKIRDEIMGTEAKRNLDGKDARKWAMELIEEAGYEMGQIGIAAARKKLNIALHIIHYYTHSREV